MSLLDPKSPTGMRVAALAQIAADIHMHGLPAPMYVQMLTNTPLSLFEMRVDNNDPDAVDAWAKHLDLGEPFDKQVGENKNAFISRSAGVCNHDREGHWLGWQWVKVWSAIYEPEEKP